MRVGQSPMRPDRWGNDVRDQPVLVNLWATCLGTGKSAVDACPGTAQPTQRRTGPWPPNL